MLNIDDRVLINIENKVAVVTLTRSEKHNALDMPMFYAIDKSIHLLRKRRDVRVVIVKGEGESFCSGLDVKSVLTNKKNALKLLWKWLPGNANLAQRVTVGWRQLKVPVIMVLHGKCWGGGMQIALGADYRIASPECSLAIMETRWGLIPDMGGTLGLAENVTADQAMILAMTSKPISAVQALNIKLVSQVSESPEQSALELAEEIIERSPDAVNTIKRVYHSIWCRQSRSILAKETLNQWSIIFRKNRYIAVKKAMGKTDIDYV